MVIVISSQWANYSSPGKSLFPSASSEMQSRAAKVEKESWSNTVSEETLNSRYVQGGKSSNGGISQISA